MRAVAVALRATRDRHTIPVRPATQKTERPTRTLLQPVAVALRATIFRYAFLMLCVIAALVPLKPKNTAAPSAAFPGWPTEWEGEPIEQVPLDEPDQRFAQGFPGRIAKFTDGRREFIFRWVIAGSRQLHSSSDCFRGMGYTITPQLAIRDVSGKCWSCFLATQREHRLLIRERISDAKGNEWTDVSAWFWSVALGRTEGPWLSVTIVEESG